MWYCLLILHKSISPLCIYRNLMVIYISCLNFASRYELVWLVRRSLKSDRASLSPPSSFCLQEIRHTVMPETSPAMGHSLPLGMNFTCEFAGVMGSLSQDFFYVKKIYLSVIANLDFLSELTQLLFIEPCNILDILRTLYC